MVIGGTLWQRIAPKMDFQRNVTAVMRSERAMKDGRQSDEKQTDKLYRI